MSTIAPQVPRRAYRPHRWAVWFLVGLAAAAGIGVGIGIGSRRVRFVSDHGDHRRRR